MASKRVQANIGYTFLNDELLHSALQAAHKSDEEGSSSDGNRGLARVGLSVIDMVETHNAIIAENGTKRDVDARDQWYKSKQGRARACEKLGIVDCVVQSVRQHHEKPSSTVLSNALCAIIGAVWLDLEERKERASHARQQVFGILRRIDDVVADTPGGHPSTTDQSTSAVSEGLGDLTPWNQVLHQDTPLLDALMAQWFDGDQLDVLSATDPTSRFLRNKQAELDLACLNEFHTYVQDTSDLDFDFNAIEDIANGFTFPEPDEVVANSQWRIRAGDTEIAHAHQRSSNTPEDPRTAAKPGKRKNSNDHRGRPHTGSLHQKLFHQEMAKVNDWPCSVRKGLELLLDDPRIDGLSAESSQVGQLRLLYLAIGSCQSLIEFKETLRLARDEPSGSIHTLERNSCPTEILREICRIDGKEALCVLSRRYHVVNLFETELEISHQNNEMIVETPFTFGTGHAGQAGNPTMMQEAALLDRLLCKIHPDLEKGTADFDRLRTQLSRLRRLAKVLRILTKTYGLGILALLPCGPAYSEFTITDSMLISITEKRFRKFSDLLYQQQGLVLKRLSKVVEPAVTALANGDLVSASLFPIELTEAGVLEGLPKGSPWIFENFL